MIFTYSNLFAHEGDSGPSSLENEFSRTSHLHLPFSYSSTHGLSFGYEIGSHEEHEHEHEHEEGHDHEEVEGDDSGLGFHVHPTVNGGFDNIRRLINLEESSQANFELEAAEENSHYLLLENKKWDLGLGLGAEAHLPIPMFAAGISISKVIGKNYYSMKILENKNEERGTLLLPVSKENLNSWREGDQVSYSTRGSLIFSVLVGIDPFFHVGPSYSHTGSYRITASMKSSDKMEVEIATLKTDSINFEADTILAGVGAGKTKGHSNSIIYSFDLSDEKVFTAISYLFEGRMDLVNQELLSSGGKIKATSDLIVTNTSVSAFYGFPVLFNAGVSRSNNYQEGEIVEHHPDEIHRSKIYMSTHYRDNYSRGILSQHKWENNSIVATVVTGEHSLLSTIFSWSFSKDNMKASQLRKKLNKIARTLPLSALKEVQFPENNLGYVKADVSMNFSGADVLFLLNLTEMKAVKEKALANLEADFKTLGHRTFCKLRSYNNCLTRYKNLINSKSEGVKTLVLSIDRAYQNKQLKTVTSDLTKIVRILFGSRYLTEAFVMSRTTLDMDVSFEGEKIKKHRFER